MKKLLLLIVLLTNPVFGQEQEKIADKVTEYKRPVFGLNYELGYSYNLFSKSGTFYSFVWWRCQTGFLLQATFAQTVGLSCRACCSPCAYVLNVHVLRCGRCCCFYSSLLQASLFFILESFRKICKIRKNRRKSWAQKLEQGGMAILLETKYNFKNSSWFISDWLIN